MCYVKEPNIKGQILSPISCRKRIIIGAETHIICGDCWWEKFANENNPHNCPGCAKEDPSSLPQKPPSVPVEIDLTDDSDED